MTCLSSKGVNLENLRQINIFIGSNNVGKTTVLEAIMGMACGYNLEKALSFFGLHRFFVAPDNNVNLLAEVIINLFHDGRNDESLHFAFEGLADEQEFFFKHKLIPSQITSSFLPQSRSIPDSTDIERYMIPVQGPLPLGISLGTPLMVDIPSYFLGNWEIQSHTSSDISFKLRVPIQASNFSAQKIFLSAVLHDFLTFRNEQKISTCANQGESGKSGFPVNKKHRTF